jgi:hypothetical protein
VREFTAARTLCLIRLNVDIPCRLDARLSQ